MRYVRIIGIAGTLLLAISVAGCFSSNPQDIEAFTKPYEVDVTCEKYVLEPPDEIEIRCSSVPEMHMQRQVIRPDGKISLEAIGEVEVAGKTPKEVGVILQEKAASLYNTKNLPGESPIDVRIAVFRSKVYYVLGQVSRPGPRTYTGRDSVLTALAEAQPNAMAWEQRVQVVRPSPDENVKAKKIFEVNFEKMTVRGDTSKDVLLQEGDIVYVPPTILAAIAMVIEEAISPIARAFYGAYLLQNPPISQQGYSPTGGGYYR